MEREKYFLFHGPPIKQNEFLKQTIFVFYSSMIPIFTILTIANNKMARG